MGFATFWKCVSMRATDLTMAVMSDALEHPDDKKWQEKTMTKAKTMVSQAISKNCLKRISFPVCQICCDIDECMEPTLLGSLPEQMVDPDIEPVDSGEEMKHLSRIVVHGHGGGDRAAMLIPGREEDTEDTKGLLATESIMDAPDAEEDVLRGQGESGASEDDIEEAANICLRTVDSEGSVG